MTLPSYGSDDCVHLYDGRFTLILHGIRRKSLYVLPLTAITVDLMSFDLASRTIAHFVRKVETVNA